MLGKRFYLAMFAEPGYLYERFCRQTSLICFSSIPGKGISVRVK